jgi:hypothetical protein
MFKKLGILPTENWKKVMVCITAFIIFFPAFLIGLDYFILNNGFILQVNNYSSRPYRLLVWSKSGIIVDKEIAPFKKNDYVKRFFRWQHITIKVMTKQKQTIYINYYEGVLYKTLPRSYDRRERLYKINIPDDKYIDLILNPSSFSCLKNQNKSKRREHEENGSIAADYGQPHYNPAGILGALG